MAKLAVFNLVSVDGLFTGRDGDISWHNVDAEFNEYAVEMLRAKSALLFGRVTYEMMAAYWPSPQGAKDDPLVASMMNGLPKVVFSRTLAKAEWNNTRVADGLEAEVRELKKAPGKELALLGSGSIVGQLTRLGLVDEYRMLVNPLILGQGRSMFEGVTDGRKLKLVKTRVFRNGNVLLHYAAPA